MLISSSRNSLSLRYINITITPIQESETKVMLGQQQNMSKSKKEMKTKAKRQNYEDPRPLRPPSMSHHAPSILRHPYQATPSRREMPSTRRCYPDQTGPRVSPRMQSVVDMVLPRRPPGRSCAKRRRHRARATQADMIFVPPRPQKTLEPRSTTT
jgi:hypothetical protein